VPIRDRYRPPANEDEAPTAIAVEGLARERHPFSFVVLGLGCVLASVPQTFRRDYDASLLIGPALIAFDVLRSRRTCRLRAGPRMGGDESIQVVDGDGARVVPRADVTAVEPNGWITGMLLVLLVFAGRAMQSRSTGEQRYYDAVVALTLFALVVATLWGRWFHRDDVRALFPTPPATSTPSDVTRDEPEDS
jgi:hypothetical protein